MTNHSLKNNLIMLFATIIAYLLSFLPLSFGSLYITLGIIPQIIIGFKLNFKYSILLGLTWAVLTLITGQAQIISPMQGLIEYPIAFASAGFANLFIQKLITKPYLKLTFASLLACTFRYFWHFIAGIIFWNYLAPKTVNPVIFSLFFNGASLILSFLVDTFVLLFLFKIQPSLFKK